MAVHQATGYAPMVEITRAGLPESMHYGAVAVSDASGRLLASWGDPAAVTYLRSSAKPFQALAVVEAGAVDQVGFTPEQVALMCASHSGTDLHVQQVSGMLAALGLTEGHLLCGAHTPMDSATARGLESTGGQPRPLHHNCSGKHAGMLALSQFLGAPPEQYLEPEGEVQRRILHTFAEMCALTAEQVGQGTDGCSAPNFAVSLHAAAAAYARLMDPSTLAAGRAAACARIVSSMTAHPELVAGPGRFDTRLMQACRGRVLSKGGAEGYLGIGLPAEALGSGVPACGLALKIADGDRSGRAVPAAALAALRQLEALDAEALQELADLLPPRPVENTRGLIVGEMRACFQLERPA